MVPAPYNGTTYLLGDVKNSKSLNDFRWDILPSGG